MTDTAIISDDSLVKQIQDTYQKLRQAHANLLAARDRYVAEARQRYEARIQQLEVDAPNIRRVLAGWDDDLWATVLPTMEDAVPAAIRVGRLVHKDDASLNDMPALLPLIGSQHIFIQADDVEAGNRLLQTLLLRMVMASRPAAVRLDLTDPIGGGSTVGSLLHLPATLRTPKAATRPEEIETLLDDLVTHIETVVQTRLLSTYITVEAYNADQPELAVPYRLLALPNFPAGLTERGWQRLQFIRQNGPRSGVYIIAAYDPSQPLPRKKMDVTEAQQGSTLLRLSGGRLTWRDPVFEELIAIPDDAPAADLINRWVGAMQRTLAQAATHVPFGRVSIPKTHRWQGDATDEIRVAVGVDSGGATHEFCLGKTNFHALVGGMPGSGKSKFLDVLITQLALAYSPDEIGFYLADLREGVTFQDYIHLPHVRVIALENEREFALNILRRMQDEIEPRSVAFKAVRGGIDNLSDYRRATGEAMPRLCMIIDEFQVLFAEDDKIASEAAKILEDIARRGRGYGIHLILSSQSPRITGLFSDRIFSQIGLRIAFRCDASVSVAILGEGNDAASELEQPGEAIYNAALGSRGRNTRMRVALLETGDRHALLAEIRAHFGDRYPAPVTFESKTAASLTDNDEWRAALMAGSQPRRRSVKVWLGEPIEVKTPTSAALRREAGRNLLIAGGDEGQAYGLLSATILSLTAQIAPSELRLIVADFARPETEMEGVMAQLASQLPRRPAVVNARQAAVLVPELATIVTDRLSGAAPVDSTICLCIAGVHRWRDLRVGDGYGSRTRDSRQSEPDVASSMARILEEGAEVGVHVIAWTDSFANFERALKRGGLSAFDLRVGLRMSESDSSNLLGSPVAARMDANRAVFCDLAESNDAEKFKPYPLPDGRTTQAIKEWAERISQQAAT